MRNINSIVVQTNLDKKQEPNSKIIRTKKIGGMSQVEVQMQSPEFKSQYSQKKKKKRNFLGLNFQVVITKLLS
jgi:hypothetical protein